MSRIIKTLFLFFVLGGLARADECQCCGVTGDLVSAVTNAVLANCSSNCVRLTPETCAQVKEGITNLLLTIESSSDYSQIYIMQLETSLCDLQISLDGLQTGISEAINLIQSDITVSDSALAELRSRITDFSNTWSVVDRPIFPLGILSVSNSWNGTTLSLVATNVNRPMRFVRELGQKLYIINPTNTAQAVITLQECSAEVANMRQEIDYNLTLLGGIQNNMNDISNSATELRTTMESFDCEPCGKGGGSGSSGGGTSVDLTPIIAAVQQLNDDLQYWMQRLYNLFQKYYQDYDTASSQGIMGKATLQGYQALPNNWFKRIEYLLYSMADLQDPDISDVPQTPDGEDDLADFESSSSSSAESQDSTLRNKAESSLNKLRTSVDNFLSAFQRLGFVNQNIDGSVVMEFPSTVDDSGTHYQLTIPQGFTSTFNFLRLAFKFVWYAGLVFLYWYFVKFAIFCIVSYVRWFLTLCSAVFGG